MGSEFDLTKTGLDRAPTRSSAPWAAHAHSNKWLTYHNCPYGR